MHKVDFLGKMLGNQSSETLLFYLRLTLNLPSNFTTAKDDELLMNCWPMNDCRTCLSSKYACGWCPTSSSCIPNSYRIPILAPAYDPGICPHWVERWDLRAKPLGCNVSTITFLTSVVSIASTLLFVVILWLSIKSGIWLRNNWRRQQYGWWNAASWRGGARKEWKILGWKIKDCEQAGDVRPNENTGLLGNHESSIIVDS
jgi:Plexin repeat